MNADLLVKNFFSQAKLALQKLLNISVELFGDELKPNYFTNIEKLVQEKFGGDDELYKYLIGAKPFADFIRETRNCIEHESPDYRIVVTNVRMDASTDISMPTFKLIHEKMGTEEVEIRSLLVGVFSNLITFVETLLVLMVGRNLSEAEDRLIPDLAYFPEGYRGNPHIRYGYAMKIGEKIVPVG